MAILPGKLGSRHSNQISLTIFLTPLLSTRFIGGVSVLSLVRFCSHFSSSTDFARSKDRYLT